MKCLMLISLLSCSVVGSVRAAQADGTIFQSAASVLQNRDFQSCLHGLGATCLGGAIGWGLGECFGAPKRGFQSGLIVPVLVTSYMAYKKNQEANIAYAILNDAIRRRLTVDVPIGDHQDYVTTERGSVMHVEVATTLQDAHATMPQLKDAKIRAIGAGIAAGFGLLSSYLLSE